MMKKNTLGIFLFLFFASFGAVFSQASFDKKTLKVAYLMPFALGEHKSNPNNARFMEFYQGSLLAIEDLKNEGVSFEIYAYDTGINTEGLGSILMKPELKKMDMIIGPVYTAQVKRVSDYTKKFDIKHIVPFSAQTVETAINPMLFQCNTALSHQTSMAAKRFVQTFKDKPVVLLEFADTPDVSDKTAELIDALKQEMQQSNKPFQAVVYKEQQQIKTLLADNVENIVVLGTNNAVSITSVVSALKASGKNFALFGMSEWSNINGVQENLFSCKLYLYAPFYIDEFSEDVIRFKQRYADIFGAYSQISMPFYNFYGYDVSLYFLSALARYGNTFEYKLPLHSVQTLQSTLTFERANAEGGYINSGLFLFTYTPEEPVRKTPF